MFIPIRSQLLSLLVTSIFVVTELLLLWVIKTGVLLFESNALRKQRSIAPYRHCFRLRFISVTILLSFVAMESFVSVFTVTEFRSKKELQDCYSLVPLSENSALNGSHDTNSEQILFRCLGFRGSTFEQRLGNFSRKTSIVSCEEEPYYTYINADRTERSTSSSTLYCTNVSDFNFDTGEMEVNEICRFYEIDGNMLYVGEKTFYASEPEDRMDFLATKIHSDLIPLVPKSVELYRQFADVYLVREELFARQVMFTNLKSSQCLFSTEEIEGAVIANFVLAIICSFWVLVVLSAVILKFSIRTSPLINLSDPFFWACKSFDNDFKLKKSIRVDESGVVSLSNEEA